MFCWRFGISREALARRCTVEFRSLRIPLLAVEELVLLTTIAGGSRTGRLFKRSRLRQEERGADRGSVEARKRQ